MTNPLILEMKVRQQKLKKDYKELQIKMARCIHELSTYIATYYGEFEEIDAEKIEQAGDELLEIKNKLIEVKQNLEKIKKELGDE